MTLLLSHYLGIPLPFPLIHGPTPRAGFDFDDQGYAHLTRLKPLKLDVENKVAFLGGLSILDYDIAFLCASQGVAIPLEKTCNTLEMLALLCGSSGLGEYIYLTSGSARVDFQLELEEVAELHQQVWGTSSQKPWEMVDHDLGEPTQSEDWDLLNDQEL